MRMLMIAATAATVMAVPADAGPRGGMAPVRPGGWNAPRPGGWNGPRPGGWNGPRPIGGNSCLGGCRPRWGGHINNRWWGGMRAPGGWGAYRRPVRGFVLPGYWVSPNWYVNDWSNYGLYAPPVGYNWSRYYDDAVLVDGRGSVYDSVGGIGWDRFDGQDVDYTYRDDAYDNGYGAAYGGYATRDRDNGLGGAVIGGVAGGVAGNVIAGRGNRLLGTAIGAGAGALVGREIDRNDRAGRVPVAPPVGPDYGAPYPAPGGYARQGAPVVAYQEGRYGGDYAGTTYSGVTHYATAGAGYPPPPGYGPGPQIAYPAPSVVAGNGTVVTTSSTAGSAGYYANGWYYPGTTITTVTVSGGSNANVVEEEVYEDASYGHAKGYRYKGKCNC